MNKTSILTILSLALFLTGCEEAPTPSSTPQPNAQSTGVQAEQYTCPMHPHYISSDPDGVCPICGMDLVPVTGGEPTGASDGSIAVAPEMIQTMGIRIEPVQTSSLTRSLRVFGTVETNERLENASVSRLEGWIENLSVRAEGDVVKKGSLLYRVYSPDLISAQKDYLNSLNIGNDKRIASVRQRLRSLGMQVSTINRLSKDRTVIERVPVYAEASGTVAHLQVREGDYVKPGSAILRLQSYAAVWIIARVPESDLAAIRSGLPVELNFPSAPDAMAVGRIDYIYPTIDPVTRTGEVRIEVDNADGYLRPGAYADISVQLESAPKLSVPTEAILKDSRGSHVIVSLGEGRFASRSVRTGISAGGLTEITHGLAAGDQIVASGQFMLDSEVNLREGLSKLEAPALGGFGPDTPLKHFSSDQQLISEMDHIVDIALYVHEALTDGYKIDPYFLDPAIKGANDAIDRFPETKLTTVLSLSRDALISAQGATDRAALAAELSRLMEALEPWLLLGAPSHYEKAGIWLFQDIGSHQLWLQEAQIAQNPYGTSEAEIISWPVTPVQASPKTDKRAPADPHAGHR